MKIVENLKTILIVSAIGVAIWFFKDYQYQKAENVRQSENMRQTRMQDSLKYAQQVLTKKEILEQLQYKDPELLRQLEEANIRINRIQKIITQRQTYRDTTKVKTEFKGLAKAVVEGVPMTMPVIDSTECWFMEAVVEFDGQEISFNLIDRKFKNKTDVVTFWERNQWKFLGLFKTRLFGKRQVTVKIFNTCGETETFVIEAKRQLK